MKFTKIALLIGVVALTSVFAYAQITYTAFASGTDVTAPTVFNDPAAAPTSLTFSPSTNVTVNCVTAVSTFAATSKHLNGDRSFGVSSDSTNIYYFNDPAATAGTALVAKPTAGNVTDFGSGWSIL